MIILGKISKATKAVKGFPLVELLNPLYSNDYVT